MHRLRILLPLLAAVLALTACGVYNEISAPAAQSGTELTTTAAATETAAETTSVTAEATTTTAEATTTEVTTTTTETTTTEVTTTTAEMTTAEVTAATAATAAADTTPAAPVSGDDSWMLVLVNSTHPLSSLTPPELTTLSNGTQVDSRMYPSLQLMFDTMRAQGLAPFVREGYRTNEMQQDILDTRISGYVQQGYSQKQAQKLALEYVAEPGTSEHQLGLAVDINASDGNKWPLYNWLAAHAHEYGFILRYPQGKEEITGISYEPWHYRYVGTDAAAEIHSSGLTLEEYLGEAGGN